VANDLFQGLNKAFHLFGNGYDVIIGYITDTDVGMDTNNRDVVFLTIKIDPILDIPTLVGVEYQDIGFGGGLQSL